MSHRALLPILERSRLHGHRPAVQGPDGEWSHQRLLSTSAAVAAHLESTRADPGRTPVGLLLDPGGTFVAALFGIWRAGHAAVPLAVSHPPAELEHALRDSGAGALMVGMGYRERVEEVARELGIPLLEAPGPPSGQPPAPPAEGRTGVPGREMADSGGPGEDHPALILYTSGSTGRPKGVVHTHRTLRAQVESLVEAWEWGPEDSTLLVLPLHHVHGLVNVVLCALWSGARLRILPRFDASTTWYHIVDSAPTLFMAVPTIYARLAAAWDEALPERRRRMSDACRGMRLMVSGSAPLPIPLLERWREITGHTLLERYGMTEIGMALSNPLHGERRPGSVGVPLPGVEVRLVDGSGSPVPEGAIGEIEVRGPGVFREYLGRPGETRAAFREGGWFRTGDVAVVEEGYWRILGRRSVDILKTGGYKVSALEIEEAIRAHPGVEDCAVVGLPDEEWGERVAAAVVFRPGVDSNPQSLRGWLRERLAPYKIPAVMLPVAQLPRNAMGKVVKPRVRELLAPDPGPGEAGGRTLPEPPDPYPHAGGTPP